MLRGSEVVEGVFRAVGRSATSGFVTSNGRVAVEDTGDGVCRSRSRSLTLPARDGAADVWLSEPLLEAIRSVLRGGGTTPSFLLPGLISGGGTKSRSWGLDGSMGGLLLSGGGLSCVDNGGGGCCGGCVCG